MPKENARRFHPAVPKKTAHFAGRKGLSRIMYVERKAGALSGGNASIGRVTFSKTRSTIYYRGLAFRAFKGGYKSNYVEVSSGEKYWISGPKKNGADRLYGERVGIEIDEDVRDEYWSKIRGLPEFRNVAVA